MIFNKGSGRFIVIEGLDGAGTTTQAQLLYDWLAKSTGTSYLTQEPSTGPAGAQIRSIITGRLETDPTTLALLFATDRLDHLHHHPSGIVRWLSDGYHVVCDRYYLSSLAYQSLENNESDEEADKHSKNDAEKRREKRRWIYKLNYRCIRPDLTIFLDVPARTCMDRITAGRGFHYELFENAEKLQAVADRYQEAIEDLRTSENIHVVKGDLPKETVRGFIKERVTPLLDTDWICSEKQNRLLVPPRNAEPNLKWIGRRIARFRDLAMKREELFLLAIKSIPHAYQALFAHAERARPISVLFYLSGKRRIVPQGPLEYQRSLKEIALHVQRKEFAGYLA